MAAPTVPITVSEDAAARVAELGMQRELQEMIEHARQTAPGLLAIRVKLEHDPVRPEDDPQVVIWVHRGQPSPDSGFDPTDWDWGRWEVTAFPPEVRLHFVMLSAYGAGDGW